MDFIRFIAKYFTETLSGVSIPAAVLLLSIYWIFTGLGQFLWENVLIRIFKKELISREQGIINEAKTAKDNLKAFKTTSGNTIKERNGTIQTLQETIKTKTSELNKLAKPTEVSTYLEVDLKKGHFFKGEPSNNVLNTSIMSLDKDLCEIEYLDINSSQLNPEDVRARYKSDDLVDHIFIVEFHKPVIQRSRNMHKFAEIEADGTRGRFEDCNVQYLNGKDEKHIAVFKISHRGMGSATYRFNFQ